MIASSKLNNRQVTRKKCITFTPYKTLPQYSQYIIPSRQTVLKLFFFNIIFRLLSLSSHFICNHFDFFFFLSYLNKTPENEGVNNFVFISCNDSEDCLRNVKSYNINYGSWHFLSSLRYDEVKEIYKYFWCELCRFYLVKSIYIFPRPIYFLTFQF